VLVYHAGQPGGGLSESAEQQQNAALPHRALIEVTTVAPVTALRPAARPLRAVASPLPPDPLLPGDDTRIIRSLLNRYRDAISTLDVAAVRAVWPSADVAAVRTGFANRIDQNVEFDACRVIASDSGATASCAGVVEWWVRTGGRRTRAEETRWLFQLQKVAGRWQIIAVETRRG
jgi:hypothetical protein